MIINWYGEGCFRVQEGEVSFMTDPFDASIGLASPRIKADMVLKTLTAFPRAFGKNDKDSKFEFIIDGAGEYNIKEIDIVGLPIFKESASTFLKTIYIVKTPTANLCFLGHLSSFPDANILEHLEIVDVLFVPAGGEPFLGQKEAVKLIKHLEPKIVIPMFFKVPGLKRKAEDIKIFLNELNCNNVSAQEKISFRRKDLLDIKGISVYLLKP
jgi:L-ascorbate metabolism protein UlaG (beta-lactamase superfamily)